MNIEYWSCKKLGEKLGDPNFKYVTKFYNHFNPRLKIVFLSNMGANFFFLSYKFHLGVI